MARTSTKRRPYDVVENLRTFVSQRNKIGKRQKKPKLTPEDYEAGNTYSDTVFCFADTVVLLRKHSDFATKTHPFIPLVLSALPMHIQAYHDPINDPRYQP